MTCDAVHPVVKLPCIKTEEHTIHKAERPKPSPQYETHRSVDVWVWWEGAFTKQGRNWPK